MPASLASIHRFPVKSCRGAEVTEAVVEPWGLAGDRRWLVVDPEGSFMTAREVRPLLLIEPTIRSDGGLDLRAPDGTALSVAVPESDPSALVPVRVWSSELEATPAGDEAAAWFTAQLGRPARLVYLDDPTRRGTNPEFTEPEDRVSFADGYPLLAATTGSLAALNALIADGKRPFEGPIAMTRFRPNVVIDGTDAWAEDGWRRVRIGDAEFRAVKGCSRCVITMTDPDTTALGKEPLATLARHRRWDGETWFGMNLVPDTPGAVIRAGDPVEILEAVPAPDGPPR